MSYQKTFQVEIDVWVTPRSETFGGVPPMVDFGRNYGEWKACVRHSNGQMEWQWCDTFDKAVAWCEKFAPKPLDKPTSPE